MKCPKCKKQLRKNARFCPACGTRIKRKQCMPKLLIIAILLVIVALGWGVGILVAKHFSSSNKTLFSEKDNVIIHNVDEAITHAKEHGEAYGYENALSELTEQVTTTISGDSYYRLQQNYKGIPVYGRTVVYAIDQEGILTLVSGNALDVVEEISLIPSVAKEKVELSITTYFTEELGINLIEKLEIAELTLKDLCIYNLNNVDTKLAYYIYSNGYELIVDAHTAEVLFCRAKIQSLTGYLVSDENHNNGFPVETDETGMYVLSDSLRHLSVYNLDGYSSAQNENLRDAAPIKSNDLIFGNDPLEGPFLDGVLLYQNLAKIHDFFYSVLDYQCEWVFGYYNDGRDSGENAFGGKYGNADGKFIGMVSMGKITGVDDVDVMGHEFTHVMTSENVNWIGSLLENRAIEEAFSDIFGILAEAWYYQTNPDWVLSGDNISVERCIFNPKSSNNASHVGDRSWFVNEETDEYYQSTIISHTAYLMWNGIDGNASKRINNDELAELWYRAMLMMPSNCNFVECRKLVERVAESMETLTNEQRRCISEAFDIVGIASRENAMTAEYHLTKNSTLSVFDEEGNLYAGYTLSIIGELIDNEPTVNIPNAVRNNRYEKTYLIEDAESFKLNLPGGLYTLTVSDKYSSVTYSVTAYVSNEGTDDSIEIFTSYEVPLVVVIPDEEQDEVEPTIEETLPLERGDKRLTSVIRYFENEKTEYYFNYNEQGLITDVTGTSPYGGQEIVSLQRLIYDSDGRIIECWQPWVEWMLWPSDSYTYSPEGYLVSETHGEGSNSEENYTLDANGRALQKVVIHDAATQTYVFCYNDIGTRTGSTVTTKLLDGTKFVDYYTYTYDESNRLIDERGSYNGSDFRYTYQYDYKPFVIYTYSGTEIPENTTVQLQDQEGHAIWSLSNLYNPHYTVDKDGYITQITESGYDGNGSTIIFLYNGASPAETTPKTGNEVSIQTQRASDLKYPISEEDCYVIFKNYYGYELPSGESYQVVVDHYGTGTEETIAFTIYGLNQNTGGYTYSDAFYVKVNSGICSREFTDDVFQADDYYY